jgi:glycosyltransferase involved in cell wall biosynthesis
MNSGVLMVTGAYWPELSGGGLQCRAMIHALKDQWRFRVFTTCTDPALPRQAEVEGIPVDRVFIDLSRRWTKWLAAVRTVRYVQRHHAAFDVVHLHGFSQKSVLLVVLALILRKKIVLTIHTAEHDEVAAARKRGWFAYWAYRQVDVYVAISSRIAHNYLAAGLPKTKLRLAPNGVDVARFHPATRAERDAARQALGGLSPDLYWILFVGFFSREKGPDLLFDAWLRLQSMSAPPSGLLFVGATDSEYEEVDATLAQEIRTVAEQRGWASRVRFTGPLSEVERAYHAADLFVMPSTREAFGMALVEAMASALPVVATEIHGVTDEIVTNGHSGVLVPPGDVAALADAIRDRLIDATGSVTMGRHARESIVGGYAIERVRNRWQDVYRAASVVAPHRQ